MTEYSNNYKIQQFRKLFSLAIILKGKFDKKEKFANIELAFDNYFEKYSWLTEHLPEKTFGGTQLLRHTNALKYYLKEKKQTQKCYGDISDICQRDLMDVFVKYIKSIL